MSHHLICVTVDTDPDTLSGQTINRKALLWDGLHFALEHVPSALGSVPLTWYVRADGQLEDVYGSATYLLDEHRTFWQAAVERGDELGWHPHLYRQTSEDDEPLFITEEAAAIHEIQRLWQIIQHNAFALKSFRMGEAWQTPATLQALEQIGFSIDSSAIPNRDDSANGHPRNWSGAPNCPYFPARHDVRQAGATRPLLEIPMTSWRFQAIYDAAPRLRYMNPCVHPELWQQGLAWWGAHLPDDPLHIWTLIFHPAEAMPQQTSDLLYAHSLDVLAHNIAVLQQTIHERGDTASFSTIAQAAQRWRAIHT